MRPFAYARAADAAEARRLLREGARPLAGGTDLLTVLKAGLEAPAVLVDVRGVPELAGASPTPDGGLRLGALTTLAELASDPRVRAAYPALAEAARWAATPQLRNQGTLGGNLLQQPRCWYYRNGVRDCVLLGGERCPCVDGENAYHALFANERCAAVHPSDPAVALVAYGASVVIEGPASRRLLAVEDLFAPPEPGRPRLHGLEPEDLLVEVVLPPAPRGSRSGFRKAMNRAVWAFALVSAAVVLVPDADGTVADARVVLGGVAYRPWRAEAAERVLVGSRMTDDVIRRAADAALEGARPLAGNAYKVDLARGVLRQLFRDLAG